MRGVEDAFLSFAGFSLVDGAEHIGSGDGPVAGAGDDATIIKD